MPNRRGRTPAKAERPSSYSPASAPRRAEEGACGSSAIASWHILSPQPHQGSTLSNFATRCDFLHQRPIAAPICDGRCSDFFHTPLLDFLSNIRRVIQDEQASCHKVPLSSVIAS